jgi:hypothetical protein
MAASTAQVASNNPMIASSSMYFLYGLTLNDEPKLVATFDSEMQLRAYVAWATLKSNADGTFKSEQGSSLANFKRYAFAGSPLTEDDPGAVFHNPSPSML